MKVIYYISNKIDGVDIVWGLLELGIEVDKSELIINLDYIIDDQVEAVAKEIVNYDVVITRSFLPTIARACYDKKVPYISWCYDSPVMELFTEEARYPTNYIFVFDKRHLERLRELGLKKVYYQPLAANVTKASMVEITDNDLSIYNRDISFIGSMYSVGYYDAFMESVAPEVRKETDELLDEFICRWEKSKYIFDRLSDESINALYMVMSKENRNNYCISDRYLTENLVLVHELSSRERFKLLNYASDNYNTVIHTFNPERFRNRIRARLEPPLKPLCDEMYKIYAAAKINLHINMRSIETGVSQRVYDIMSVGGTVFTTYQEEAEELFVPDKEIVTFKSLEEFKDKADYYLSHDKERLEIGARGYLRVSKEYNYPNAIRNMLSKL